jgi:hypothetical protein
MEYKFQVRSEESTTVVSVPGKCSPVLFLFLSFLLSLSSRLPLPPSVDKVLKSPWSVVTCVIVVKGKVLFFCCFSYYN